MTTINRLRMISHFGSGLKEKMVFFCDRNQEGAIIELNRRMCGWQFLLIVGKPLSRRRDSGVLPCNFSQACETVLDYLKLSMFDPENEQ